MNPSGQSQVVNDRKNQFSLGTSLGCRHHLASSEKKLASPQRRFRTSANTHAWEQAPQNLHSDQDKEGKDRNREMCGWRDHCEGGFWIQTLQMHTSPMLFPPHPSVCHICIFLTTIGHHNTWPLDCTIMAMHELGKPWVSPKQISKVVCAVRSDHSSKQSKHTQCKKTPPSSSVCTLLPCSQTRPSHKGLFLWSKTRENNHTERLGYIKKLCGFVRYDPLVFSFQYLQLWIVFIEKKNIATKSFLAKISGPFCIILSVSCLLRPPLLHWN